MSFTGKIIKPGQKKPSYSLIYDGIPKNTIKKSVSLKPIASNRLD